MGVALDTRQVRWGRVIFGHLDVSVQLLHLPDIS